jgi:glycosyltransferase involved in cell wall biosynthesis
VLAGLKADLVHVASVVEGAADDVTTGWPTSHRRLPLVATFYDAIPLLWRSEYLSDPKLLTWYFRHFHELKQCTALLSISESSRQEAIDHLGSNPSYTFNIRAGFDAEMFRPIRLEAAPRAALLARYGLRDGFALFVGAGDPRKNDVGLLRAYGCLPAELQAKHQLVVVGSQNVRRLTEEANALGVQAANVVLLPHVPDADLPSLYSVSRCFVMPSKHEGFGLPALEAMACGTAVIASNTTSLPEVVGLEDALFDPFRPDDVAIRLQRVLTDETFHRRLVEHGLVQAKRFSWTASAKRAWEALEVVQISHPDCATVRHHQSVLSARKLSLAFVGPLPPDASDIAYSASGLVLGLDKYYDVTLVTTSGVVDDPALDSVFPVIDQVAFAKIAGRFDRIVYQVGNSEFHIGIVNTLLPQHPGVVVLHDTCLGNIPLNVFLQEGDRGGLARALFESDGWPALKLLSEDGERSASSRFPHLRPVFDHALGVLVFSAHARELVGRYIGPTAREMVRPVPTAREPRGLGSRAAARTRLGIDAAAPLVCSVGMVTAATRPLDVLEVWYSAFGSDPAASLAFVGYSAPDVTASIRIRATELGAGGQVLATGHLDQTSHQQWLDAADMAVQLCTDSGGRTSAAIADCMAAGLPVLANTHGSLAEFPRGTIELLPDLASVAEIGAALAMLWADSERRNNLSKAASAHARTNMSPVAVGSAYQEAIEHFYASGGAARLREALPDLSAADHPDAVRSLAVSFPPPSPPRLFLDVSAIVKVDAGTGIQRVIREIGRRVLTSSDGMAAADMVRLDGTLLRYAHDFAGKLLGLPQYGLTNRPVLAKPGDTLVLMDPYGDINAAEAAELRRQRRLGAKVVVVVYDILPLQRPAWFPPTIVPFIQHWMRESLSIADAALCISRTVAEDLTAWLDAGADDGTFIRNRPLDVGWFHLGSDFSAAKLGEPSDPLVGAALTAATQRPTLLMVGTIEPRKGHAQALAAFEQLWAAEEEIGLTIVGKPGWSTELLVQRIREHPEAGRRLHWLTPSDADLALLYAGSSGLLVASEGEGFGLPIIEAARAGVPVLARDIPVFREIAGHHAVWFEGSDPTSLATALREWRARAAAGELPSLKGVLMLTWDDSAKAFLQVLRTDLWPMCWRPRLARS